MSIFVQCNDFVLSESEVARLWGETRKHVGWVNDDEVVVRCVDEGESRRLNGEYRGGAGATNVLTFSYGEGRHDVAVCLPVVEREAGERGETVRGYVALVLIHALLHAAGMDHERSAEEATRMAQAEQSILVAAGFPEQEL